MGAVGRRDMWLTYGLGQVDLAKKLLSHLDVVSQRNVRMAEGELC